MTVYAADWVVPVDGPPIEDGAVAFDGDRIVAVGSAAELGPPDDRFADAVILPGLVNAHSHVEYAVYSGFGDGLEFVPWIVEHVRRKRGIAWEDHLAIARLGAADCLRSGITTIGDASNTGAAAVAADELGLRGIVYLEIFGRTPDEALSRFEESRERVESAFSERLGLGISPHTPFNISNEIYAAAAALDLPVATHLSESTAELLWVRDGSGPFAAYADAGHILTTPCGTSGIRRLADAGLLGPHVIAAHCVQVDEDDVALLAEHDVGVAHCPRSNALLGCGIAPLAEFLAAGIRVGLGTDSPASTPSFDMFEELRAAVYCARARERRPDALTAESALELATVGAARALGLDDEIGSLTPGKRADLAVLSLRGSPYLPLEDAAAAAVFGGSPERIARTVVGGEVRYTKGDEEWHEELRKPARTARGRLLASAAATAAVRTRP